MPNIDNLKLARVTFNKNLSILFDHNMFFSLHINLIVSKPFKMLGFINRNTINLKNIKPLSRVDILFPG